MDMDERIKHAFEHSKVLKWPKQLLSSFGSSEVNYHVLTEPVYQEFTKGPPALSPGRFREARNIRQGHGCR